MDKLQRTVTFEIEGTQERRQLRIPNFWLVSLADSEDKEKFPGIQKYIAKQRAVGVEIFKTPMHKRAGDPWPLAGRLEGLAAEELPHISALELASAWEKIRQQEWKEASRAFQRITLPLELQPIMDQMDKEGMHLVVAEDWKLRLLGWLLQPVASAATENDKEYSALRVVTSLMGEDTEWEWSQPSQ